MLRRAQNRAEKPASDARDVLLHVMCHAVCHVYCCVLQVPPLRVRARDIKELQVSKKDLFLLL